jgi:hypothetical protein
VRYPAGPAVTVTVMPGVAATPAGTVGKKKGGAAGAAGAAAAAARAAAPERKGDDTSAGVGGGVTIARAHAPQSLLLPYVAMLLYFCFDDLAAPFAQGRAKALVVAGADGEADSVPPLTPMSPAREVALAVVQSFLRRGNAHPARYVRKSLLQMVEVVGGGH